MNLYVIAALAPGGRRAAPRPAGAPVRPGETPRPPRRDGEPAAQTSGLAKQRLLS